MYEHTGSHINLPALERTITDYWRRNDVFARSVEASADEAVFYDGPPFPTGTPHPGTIFVSILKDAFARFLTMTGKSVPRRWGWDCHGLPIETAVEKQLGVTNKHQIEDEIGVAAFNDACRRLVSSHDSSWERYIERIGRWVDYEHAYRTMDRNYMESVMWVFAESHRRGLIYRDFRVVPYCYRCETSLSVSDTRESDATRPRQDPALSVEFTTSRTIEGLPVRLVAWTTTPWTLPANLALAVGPEIEYVAVERKGAALVLSAAAHARGLAGASARVLRPITGAELVGWTYEPPYAYFRADAADGAFRVLGADFVSQDDGTGIVHLAPAHGEDDYWRCREAGIRLRNPVDESGRFTEVAGEFAGMNVHAAQPAIIADLKARGLILRHDTIEHAYPHCWRCRTPLIYRAMDAWYYRVGMIKDALLEANEAITWVPETVKHGRFRRWIEQARDWNISRNRYWGTPIPVWECNRCGTTHVVGSARELEECAGGPLDDLHVQALDPITFACPTEGCDGTMRRVREVLDGWFESGAMPFGQCHYPFENREWFESHFPADFIVEYPGQIRGWFYCMHVLAVGVMGRPAFRTCLVHGTLLADDGTKMSKSLHNYTDPMDLLDEHGADALRLYLLGSPAAVMTDLRFTDDGVVEQVRKVILPLWNAFVFFSTYANADGYERATIERPTPPHETDRWILARLDRATTVITSRFHSFEANGAAAEIDGLVTDLTNWYVRRSRRRFWAPGLDLEKRSAYDTLHFVLATVCRLIAPLVPFIAERIYLGLLGLRLDGVCDQDAPSVHLCPWPVPRDDTADESLIEDVAVAQRAAELGLALRSRAGIRVRQPLARARVALPPGARLSATQREAIAEELNVKQFELVSDPAKLGRIRAVPNARLLGPRLGAEVQRLITAARAGAVREDGGRFVVTDGKTEWSLAPNEIDVSYEGTPGSDVASDRGVLVSLDTTLTAELREEGAANEINRHVQELRKRAGYGVSERIELDLGGAVPAEWSIRLHEWALASPGRIVEADAETIIETDSGAVTIRLRRAQRH